MTTRDVVLIAVFAALIAVLGLLPPVPIGIVPVPITLQTLGIMLAGAYLGAWRGLLATLLLICLVLLGLPVLAGGRGGMVVLAGPTAGFLLGWIPGALVTGWFARLLQKSEQARGRRFIGLFLACVLGGIMTVYLCGIIWLAAVTGLALRHAAVGTLLFVPGDLIKAAFAAWIIIEIGRAYPMRA